MSELALQTATPSSSTGSPVAAAHAHAHALTHTHHTPKSHKASKSSSASGDVPRFRPRACARCSISKLKCNWPSEPGEAPCERCARSRSECVLPSLKPRGPRRGNPTRVGQLEQKIDGIMSLLTASKHISKTGAKADPKAGPGGAAAAGMSTASAAPSAAASGSDSLASRTSTSTPTPPTVAADAFMMSESTAETKTESHSSPDNYILASSDRAARWGSPPSAGVPSASSQSPVAYPHPQLPHQQQQQQYALPDSKPTLPPISPSAPVSPAPTSSSLPRGERSESTLPLPGTPSQYTLYRLPQPQQQQQPQRPPSRQYLLPPYPPPLSVSPRSSATSSLLQQPLYATGSNGSSSSVNASVTLPPIMAMAPVEPPPIEIAPGIRLSYYEADAALAEYGRTYLPHFPFVPIAPGVSAYDLSRQHPLLFRVIVLVVYMQSADASAAALADARQALREQMATRVVVRGEASVELLQALLLYVAWLCNRGDDDDKKQKESATPLVQLAVGIVHDLRLDEHAYELDEMRAVLGCFYVCAVGGALAARTSLRRRRRIPVFAFSPHMADCCDRLRAARDYQSDELVCALAKLYQVAQHISTALPCDDAAAPAPVPTPTAAAPGGMFAFAPVSMAMAPLRTALTALADSQPPHVRQNSYFWVHLYAVMIRLYEPALSAPPAGRALSDRPRTEALWSCMQAATDYFDAYTSIPAAVLGVLPVLAAPQFTYCAATLARLLELDDVDWNQDQVRRCVDAAGLTQQVEDHLKTADDHAAYGYGRRASDEPFGKRRRRLDSQLNKMYWLRMRYTVKGRKAAYAQDGDVDMDKTVVLPDGREMSAVGFDAAFSMAMYDE